MEAISSPGVYHNLQVLRQREDRCCYLMLHTTITSPGLSLAVQATSPGNQVRSRRPPRA